MAFRIVHGSKIRNDLGRLHDHFPKKQHAWADDLRGNVYHPDELVNFRKVAAIGAQGLPYVWCGIESYDVDVLVA